MSNPVIQLRSLQSTDISFGMELSTLAEWNQTPDDWKFFIEHDPLGNYLASYHGLPAGTVTTLPYQDHFCWIGMALVHPDYRRKGIGKTLLKAAIDYARKYGTVRLDATASGRALYQKLGFWDECDWVRMVRSPGRLSPDTSTRICPLASEHLRAIHTWDSEAFGASRWYLLQHLYQHYPDLSYVNIKNHNINGYCLGRKGRIHHQIGPLVAADPETARALLLHFLHDWQHVPVVIDSLKAHSVWMETLRHLGFEARRTLYRMNQGKLSHTGNTSVQFALAGPEYG